MLRAGSTHAVQDIEIAYFDGTGSYGKSTSSASYGFNICPYEFTRENLLIHHCKLLGFCEAFRSNMWKNATIEYCVISDTPPDDFDHEDFIYNYPGENVTIRYSIWANSPNDGISTSSAGPRISSSTGIWFMAHRRARSPSNKAARMGRSTSTTTFSMGLAPRDRPLGLLVTGR